MGANDDAGKLRPLARFDPQLFTKLLVGMGLDYRWSRAVECPCRLNEDTGQWDPTCVRCGGEGWWYVNPCIADDRSSTLDYAPVKAIFSTVADNPSLTEDFGAYPFGVADLTVQNSHRVGFHDRFIGVQQEFGHTELLIRGDTAALPIGRNGRTREEQEQALRYEPMRINFCAHADGTPYFEGLDFVLTPGYLAQPTTVTWLAGRGPAAGDRYTVHYDYRPVWVVTSGVYHVQQSVGPAAGIKGAPVLQNLPTTFKVALDFLTPARGD